DQAVAIANMVEVEPVDLENDREAVGPELLLETLETLRSPHRDLAVVRVAHRVGRRWSHEGRVACRGRGVVGRGGGDFLPSRLRRRAAGSAQEGRDDDQQGDTKERPGAVPLGERVAGSR